MADLKYYMVAAVSRNGVIGDSQKPYGIPFRFKEDMKFFKDLTSGHSIIVGRKTFELIGKVLPDRLNIVLSSSDLTNEEIMKYGYHLKCKSPEYAMAFLDLLSREEDKTSPVFVCGGNQVYREMLPYLSGAFITHIDKNYEGDTYLSPKIQDKLEGSKVTQLDKTTEDGVNLNFNLYEF